MNQTEPLSQTGDPALDTDMAEPLTVMPMEEAPTMEGRSTLRVFLVMMALAVGSHPLNLLFSAGELRAANK